MLRRSFSQTMLANSPDCRILDGHLVAKRVYARIQGENQDKSRPCLAIIHANDRHDSRVYISQKLKAIGLLGFAHRYRHLDKEEATFDRIKSLILEANDDGNVHGIILQSPVYGHIDYSSLSGLICCGKDVDGANHLQHDAFLQPCTAAAVLEILKHYRVDLAGKHVLVIGRGRNVGEPVARMLCGQGSTVATAHSGTPQEALDGLVRTADILVSATGQSGLVDGRLIKSNAVAIDVGISMDASGRICGDIRHPRFIDYWHTPVPGGVGPVTVAKLMENLWRAYGRASLPHGR